MNTSQRSVLLPKLATVALAALMALATTGTALAHSSFLKVDGRTVRNQNGTGDPIFLRGVNLGGWQVHEGWMSPLGGVSDDYTMRKTLSQRFGDSGRDALINAYQDSYLQEKDFRILSDLGMSAVRLPIYYLNHMNEDGSWKRDAAGRIDFRRIEWTVAMAKKYRMYVILDLHGAPGSQNGADHSGRIGGSGQLWNNTSYQNQTLTFWRELATRFRNEPTVAGYDVLNEPSLNYPAPATRPVLDLYDRIYKEIRAVDPHHIVIMEGIWDWSAITRPSDYGWTNVIYEFHYYNWGNDANYQSQVNFTEAKINQEKQYLSYNVPHYVGEFMYFNLQSSWEYGLRRYNEAGWHWTSWTYKGTNIGNWALYNSTNAGANTPNVNSDSYATIEAKWRNWDVEKNMAPNTMLNSVFKAALTGKNSLIRNLPFEGTWRATSKLEAEMFYAQSGVSFDSTGIGSFDAGDWLRYIDMDFGSGVDRLKLRLAVDASSAGKQIEVRLDSPTGAQIGTVTVPSTGGWTSFQEVTTPIQRSTGVRNLYLVAKGGTGVANIDWLQFEDSTGTNTPTPPTHPPTTPPTTPPGSTAPVSGQTYALIAKHSGKALDVRERSTQDGGLLQQWAYGAGANQKWVAQSAGNGLWQLRSTSSNKCVDVSGVSTANGAAVQQWTCTGGGNQLFRLEDQGNGFFYLRASHSNKCLDVTNVSAADGAGVQQWDCAGDNARWKFQAP
jgi:aryl-phospho-beta-D-glucosidase BglC (GH1 family)